MSQRPDRGDSAEATRADSALPLLELRTLLADGTGADEAGAARRALGLAAGAEDKLFARALVRAVAAAALPALPELASGRPAPDAEDLGPTTASRSFMMRATHAVPAPGLSIARLDDVRTLLLVARGGALFQRREAVRRIGELLSGDSTLTPLQRRQALEGLSKLHYADLAQDVSLSLARLPGSEGRGARAEQRTLGERAEQLAARITAFWDGEEAGEPLAELHAEERAQLLARLRTLPDLLARHVGALIEDAASLGPEAAPKLLLGALEHSSDPRLVPPLRSWLLTQDADTFAACVRAVSATEDPRVAPILRDAHDGAVRPRDRLALAAGLGRHGDARGLAYARETLAGGDPGLLAPALEVLAEIGSSEDAQRIVELLEHADAGVQRAAITALGRIGDARALGSLSGLRVRVPSSALRAHIEDAEDAIQARIELLGEEAPSQLARNVAWDTHKMVARARTRDPAAVRVRARLYHALGYMWLVLGAPLRAVARFEAATALRPGWSAPVLALAQLYVRRRETPLALAAFRRAIDIDRAQLEGDAHLITAMAQTFLRRAEAMEREGRLDIARSLLEEALGYDLRRAAAEVRFALEERLQLQLARERTWKP